MDQPPPYRRILIKLSGEALMGSGEFGLDMDVVGRIAAEVAAVSRQGRQVALVVGGGNIFRGLAGAAKGLDRTVADHMGMLATVMNALAFAGALRGAGADAVAMSAIPMQPVCETYTSYGARAHLDAGRIVMCAAGTGNPFFTTDTAAALRAAELGCDALFKATQVDGIYSADPKRDPAAVRYDRLTFSDVIARDLRVMDTAAIALARDNRIPVIVFDIHEAGALEAILAGGGRSTLVSQ
jgi:uridylate kinase